MLSFCLFPSLSLYNIPPHTYIHMHTHPPLPSLSVYLLFLTLVYCSIHVCVLSQAVHCAASPDGVDPSCRGSRGAPSQFLGGQRWRTAGGEALTAGSWLRTSTVKVSPRQKSAALCKTCLSFLARASEQAGRGLCYCLERCTDARARRRVRCKIGSWYLLTSVDKLVAW